MIEKGQIINTNDSMATVRIRRHSLCSKCTNKCGLARQGSHEVDEIEVEVDNEIGARVGNQVKIEMGEQSLVLSSLIVYLFPLLALIAGYFIAAYFASYFAVLSPEIAGIIGSFVLTVISFVILRYANRFFGRHRDFQPHITDIIGSD